MTHTTTHSKKTVCAKLAAKQAIKDSMAPLAPFPAAKTTFTEHLRQHVLSIKNKH